MAIAFKQESFRGDYKYANSAQAIERFPFPFPQDNYMYSVNTEPHSKGPVGSVFEYAFDIDEHYLAECEDRRITLERDPERCQSLPHMIDAEWDTLELIMESLARDYPEHFMLQRDGARWTWINRPLDLRQEFVFGDVASLPRPPFEYIMRQIQGDFVIMDQRENNLFMDAGIATAQADWSLSFDLGMNFMQWHSPVPLADGLGIFERALKYLMMVQVGRPVRRLNWTMTINPRLDTAPETYPEWGQDRNSVTAENVGKKVHLRVEAQVVFRLPRSNAMLFSIRCYLANLEELATYPRWAARLHRVLGSLPPELVEYKGLTRYRPTALQWLAAHDDGRELAPGTQPL